MKKKSIQAKQISYMVIICLFVILGAQFYMVYDYYQTTRAGLVRESDAILQETFKKDLNVRRTDYNKITRSDVIDLTKKSKSKKETGYDFTNKTNDVSNDIDLVDLALNIHVSKVIPINIEKLDSITGTILKSRNINSNYQVLIIDKESGKVMQHSKNNSAFGSIFEINSKLLTIEINPQKSLQLVLINPFGVIFKRIGVMLLTSFVFSVICLLAFGFLQRILSRQKQLVAFKNEFLSTIAHELKRPVASLSYNLDCLTLPAFKQDEAKHDLLVVRSISATEELNNTINMIVALAKVEEGLLKLDKEPVNLSQLFLDLKERFMNYPVKNIEIRTAFESEITTIQADTRLLTQCFANLIDNSIKYSGRDVLIVINIQHTGNWIVISIKDNGFGMPEEKLPVIFDKYTRLESPNTTINGFGIGLNYVKTIVEKHEGEVEVQSKQGEGTKFNILLPL